MLLSERPVHPELWKSTLLTPAERDRKAVVHECTERRMIVDRCQQWCGSVGVESSKKWREVEKMVAAMGRKDEKRVVSYNFGATARTGVAQA